MYYDYVLALQQVEKLVITNVLYSGHAPHSCMVVIVQCSTVTLPRTGYYVLTCNGIVIDVRDCEMSLCTFLQDIGLYLKL